MVAYQHKRENASTCVHCRLSDVKLDGESTEGARERASVTRITKRTPPSLTNEQSSITNQIGFNLRVLLSKLASSTSEPKSGGDRKGVNRVATSKPSTSSCLTLLLGREGRVESNRWNSYGNAADIAATRFVSARYNPDCISIRVGFKTIARFLNSVAGASWVMTKNCVCNCRLNPSLDPTLKLLSLSS